jgi:tetratricopeptide (TPR) repeat protein
LELKPGVAHTHELYGLFLAVHKRFPEAMAEIERAQQLDPLSPSVSNGVGRFLHFQRKFDAAVAQYQKTLALDPNFAEAHFSLGMTYGMIGRYDEALAEITRANELTKRPVYTAMMAIVLAREGRHAEVEKIYADALEAAKTTPMTPYQRGMLESARGNLDEAFRSFNQAYDERDGIIIYLPIDPVSEVVWTDPRFLALAKRMNLNE